MTIYSDTAYERSNACRISGSPHLVDLIGLGDQPLANSLKSIAAEPELRVPLTLSYSPESALVQLRETVRKEILFSQYVWVSGTARATREFAKTFAESITQIAALGRDELILEIASNDGTFLKPFIENGYRNVVGVDPARNIVELAEQNGVRTIAAFWDQQIAQQIVLERGRAKVIIARNVIPHVSQLEDVMRGMEIALAADGVGAVEFHYAAEILDGLQYDSIYHEHLCYFSLASFTFLLQRFGLHAFDAAFSPISGGALIVYFSKEPRQPTAMLRDIEGSEVRSGINELHTWQRFAAQCREHRERSVELLARLRGARILGYGSSARSSTYLNYCGFGQGEFAAVVDNSPLKQGKFTPGSSLPIVSLADGLRTAPEYIFIFAWNFRTEIMQSCRNAGYRGSFITAFPNEPTIWQ